MHDARPCETAREEGFPMFEQRRIGASGTIAVAVVAAAVIGSAAALAQTAPEPQAVSPGREAYLQYCASCHGPDADGKGPMAEELRRPPADLTRLTERFGSPLRPREVLDRVDGRNMARAHGSSEMPVWGRKLASNAPRTQGTEVQTRGTLLIIIDYLASLQE
jgi:mono/diheme cytochrome c family protein